MTLQQLHYVLAVARTGSFSRAAEECFVTQPTLSAQIGKLERELDAVLLDRAARPIVATQAGRLVLRAAEEAMHRIDRIPSLVQSQRTSLVGTLVVGVIATLSQYLLPLFLPRFLERYPGIRVEVHEEVSDHILAMIADERIDVGILATPTGVAGLNEETLFYEEFVGYFPPAFVSGFTLDLPDVLPVTLLPWAEMLLLAEGHCFRDQVIDICHREEVRGRRLEFETGSLESLKCLVDEGLGYTLLPELATLELSGERRARLRSLAEPVPAREIGLVRREGFLRVDLLAAFRDAMLESLPPKVRANTGKNRVPWRARR